VLVTVMQYNVSSILSLRGKLTFSEILNVHVKSSKDFKIILLSSASHFSKHIV